MKKRHIRWTIRALQRLDDIGAYIQRTDPEAASKVVMRLIAATDMLSELPATGRAGRIAGTRELVVSDLPYIIAYRVRQDIEILTVLHTSQQWPVVL